MTVIEGPKSAGLVARVTGILTRPAAEWDVINGEAASIQGLFTGYACIVAAIYLVASIVSGLFLAALMPFHIMHFGPVAVVGRAVFGYIATLATTFVTGFIIDALAPSFGGERNPVQAMKLAVYSWTAVWVSSIAIIIPILGGLVMLAALFYSLYTFWIGLPKLMKSPVDRSSGYALVCMVASFIAAVIIFAVFMVIRGMFAMGSWMTGGMF